MDDEADLIRVMVVAGPSPDKDLEGEVSDAEERKSYIPQGLELQQCMLREYPEDKLRLGMKELHQLHMMSFKEPLLPLGSARARGLR